MSEHLINARKNPKWEMRRTSDGWTLPYNTKTDKFLSFGTKDWVDLLNAHDQEVASYEDEIEFLVRSGEEKDELISELLKKSNG